MSKRKSITYFYLILCAYLKLTNEFADFTDKKKIKYMAEMYKNPVTWA